ncbi:MAG: DUF433 domain-containing protein, partial [Dongiaceae bacterium]
MNQDGPLLIAALGRNLGVWLWSKREMKRMEKKRIVSRDPSIVSGALVFAGTRVPVQILVDYLKAGETLDRFLEGFP